MTEVREFAYFDMAAERERQAASLDLSVFDRNMTELSESPLLAQALRNQALDSDQPLPVPSHLIRNSDLLLESDEAITAEVRRWQKDVPYSELQKQRELHTYLLAKRITQRVLDDPRTTWAIEQGLTLLPAEVIVEAQAEFLESTTPVISDDVNAQEATSMGINAAVATLAQRLPGVSMRELFEITSIHGLIISLGQEIPSLPVPYFETKPIEYIGHIREHFTGAWIQNLEYLRGNYRWEESTEVFEAEIDALVQIAANIVYDLVADFSTDQRNLGEAMAAERHNHRLRHAADFLVDLINARWHIVALPAARETGAETATIPEATKAEEMSPEASLASIFEQATALGVSLPASASFEAVLSSLEGKTTVRGNFRPEESLRNALVAARRRARQPQVLRSMLARLQDVINHYTSDN
jgi:hypothetical protein